MHIATPDAKDAFLRQDFGLIYHYVIGVSSNIETRSCQTLKENWTRFHTLSAACQGSAGARLSIQEDHDDQ